MKYIQNTLLLSFTLMISVFAGLAIANDYFVSDTQIASMRGDTPLDENPDAPRLANVENDDITTQRDYPQLAPLIAHKIENYQIDLRANKCLSCHARQRTGQSGAPMIGESHFKNRDGEYLADVSPNRYFCTQCHVPQTDAPIIVESDFIPMDQLLNNNAQGDH